MNTYTTLDGDVLDLTRLSDTERRFLEEARERVAQAEPWGDFSNWIHGPSNPVLLPGARLSREVAGHPLYRAVRDMADRLGIAQRRIAPSPGDDIDRDPFDDTMLTVAEAASAKGVTVMAVHKAIERGDLVVDDSRPRKVSRNSLDGWHVNETRQKAGARGGAPATRSA